MSLRNDIALYTELSGNNGNYTSIEIIEAYLNGYEKGKAYAHPERKARHLSNKEWIDFLVAQFDISRTSARDMLHVMMQVKREDNFKKQFSQGNNYLVKDLVKKDGKRTDNDTN